MLFSVAPAMPRLDAELVGLPKAVYQVWVGLRMDSHKLVGCWLLDAHDRGYDQCHSRFGKGQLESPVRLLDALNHYPSPRASSQPSPLCSGTRARFRSETCSWSCHVQSYSAPVMTRRSGRESLTSCKVWGSSVGLRHGTLWTGTRKTGQACR